MKVSHTSVQPTALGRVGNGCCQSLRVEIVEIKLEISRSASSKENTRRHWGLTNASWVRLCVYGFVSCQYIILPLKNLLIASIWQTSGSSVGTLATLTMHFFVFCSIHLTARILDFSSSAASLLLLFDPVQKCHPNQSEQEMDSKNK